MAVLLAAEKWGIPPWEIDEDEPSRLLWLMRLGYFEEQRAKALEDGASRD
jgi:hypothetical protein